MKIFNTEFLKRNRHIDEYRLVHLDQMVPVLTYFNLIDINNVTNADFCYLTRAMARGKDLDVDELKYDIEINKINKYTAALKYFQPLEVVEDIIENRYCKKTKIVYSKIYKMRHITKLIGSNDFKNYALLSEKKGFVKYKSKDKLFWYATGKVMLENMDILNNQKFRIDNIGDTYISLTKASAMILDVKHRGLFTNGTTSVFGIEINSKMIRNRKVYSVSDCKLALLNKKYYILRNELELLNKIKVIDRQTLGVVTNLFIKNNVLACKWIHKDIAIKINNLALAMYNNDHDQVNKIIIGLVKEHIKNNPEDNTVLIVDSVAKILKISHTALRRILTEGKIFNVKAGLLDNKTTNINNKKILKILEAKGEYVYLFKTTIFDNITKVDRDIIANRFKRYFLYKYYFKRSEFHLLLKSISNAENQRR